MLNRMLRAKGLGYVDWGLGGVGLDTVLVLGYRGREIGR
jgi:hypothetical protein